MANRESLEASNLNSQNFDPSKYLTNFLKTNNIRSLIQKNIELEQDIKNYDQDIQSLVFENYNKFIISIETVKKMKENIIKVDEKLKVLSSSMQNINGLVYKIDDNLKVKRLEIQKLDTVNKDLQKLKKICEFPDVLKADISDFKAKNTLNTVNYEQIFTNSIDYYKGCFALLSKLKTEPLIKPIYCDSINNIEEMRSIIWNLQSNKGINIIEMRVIIKKLLIIIEDKELVLKNYLKFIKEKFISNLRQILDSYSIITDESGKIEEEMTIKFLNEKKHDVSLEELEVFKGKIQEEIAEKEVLKEGTCLWLISRLLSTIFPDIAKEISFLYNEISPLLCEKASVFSINGEKSDKNNGKNCGDSNDFTDKIENIVKDITMVILTNISEKLSCLKLSNMQINDSFKRINTELNGILNKNINKSLRTEIIDKFTENIEHVYRSQLFDSFSIIRLKFLNLLVDLKRNSVVLAENREENELETMKKEIFSSLNSFKNKLYCIISTALIEMKPFITKSDNFLQNHLMFFSLLHSQFTEFVKLMIKMLILKGDKFSMENITIFTNSFYQKKSPIIAEILQEIHKLKGIYEDSSYYLIINQFLIIFEKKFLYKYFEILFELYHKNQPSDLSIKQQYQSLRMNIENIEIPKLAASLKGENWLNLLNYCQYYSQLLMKLLKKYLNQDKWNVAKEFTGISEEILAIVPIFKRILLELSVLFPDLKRGIVKKNSFIKFKSALDIDMERILAKKSHHFERGDLNRNSLLLSILKSFLKGIIEKFRKLRFEKNGFQQVEIDMFFVVQICYEMVAVDDEALIIGFYFEMIMNAAEMCTEVVHVEQGVVESVANAWRNKVKI